MILDFQKKNWQFRDLIAEGELNRMEDGIEEGITKAEQAQDTADNAISEATAAQDAINNHIAATTGVHGATSAATPNTIVQRDSAGRFKASAPAASDDVARKAETDAALSAAQAAQNTANAAFPRRIFTSGTYDFNNRGDGSFIEEVKSNASITFQNGPPGVTSGTLIQGEGSHNKWQTQLYMMQGNERKIFFRTSADVNGTKEWRDWVELITSAGGQTIYGEIKSQKNGHNYVTIETQGSGNPNLRLHAQGVSEWLMYIDRADSGKLKIMDTSVGSSFLIFNRTSGIAEFIGPIRSKFSSGNEGGEIQLAKPQTTSLGGDVVIDVIGNRLRIFESSSSAKGVYVDLSTAPDDNQGELWHTGKLRINNDIPEFLIGGSWRPVGGIKSVQRGSTSTYVDNSDPENPVLVLQVDVPISAVNTNKAFVVITSTWARDGSGAGGQNYQAHAQLLNSTTVRINATLADVTVHWQVVESY